ncbi:MAG: biopolymer transporter ExbD [Spirochaetaceae bacterium]|nr:MAG: biopolymer transporter ExbD [Spirochaetaceae bacterium]
MKLKTRKRDIASPGDSGVMSDLAFLLIIYFMVIAGFQLNYGFLLSLPEKGGTSWIQEDDLAIISLQADGSIKLRDEVITFDDLGRRIEEQVARRPNMTIQLLIHPQAIYQNVVDILGMVHRLKVENFSFRLQEDNE